MTKQRLKMSLYVVSLMLAAGLAAPPASAQTWWNDGYYTGRGGEGTGGGAGGESGSTSRTGSWRPHYQYYSQPQILVEPNTGYYAAPDIDDDDDAVMAAPPMMVEPD
ncbi:MAG TPA: hypothetical protein VGD36_18840 [Xanthobacteraceae bacterium]